MKTEQLDWGSHYIVPAGLRFRLTPAGDFQVDGDGGEGSVEVAGGYVDLLLGFARSQAAGEAFEQASAKWEVDRETYRRLLEVWIAQGLLRKPAAAAQVNTRLALVVGAMADPASASSRPVPLTSHFKLQRPQLFYPGLATREVHDGRDFPWVATLEASYALISAEFAGLLASAEFSRIHPDQTSKGEWAAAYLWAFGKKVEEICLLCPETTRLLSSIPGAARFGTTLFSALGPHSHIAPHFGYTNAKLRCQLPLRVPADCRLKVGDQELEQREGRCIVFDDSFLHSAWNDSDEARFVLVFDFFHPDLTGEEIEYLAQLAEQRVLAKSYLDQAAAGPKAGWVKEPQLASAAR
jgi:hypothetical protein